MGRRARRERDAAILSGDQRATSAEQRRRARTKSAKKAGDQAEQWETADRKKMRC